MAPKRKAKKAVKKYTKKPVKRYRKKTRRKSSKIAAAMIGNQNAIGNDGGAPTKFRPEYNDQARKLCMMGATDKELADFFEVCEDTITEWKKVHSEFSLSLKKGKMIADAEVASKLYERATGYEHDEVDIKVIKGKVVKTKLRKFYPPETVAAIFWLKNRQKISWRDKQEIGVDFDYTKLPDDRLLALLEKSVKKLE